MDEYRPSGSGLGCIWWVAAGALIVLLIMSGGGPDSKNTTPGSSITNSRAGTLSGNQMELMSRNQVNLWSDVTNCFGDNSCVTIVTSTTSTVQNTTTDTRNTVTTTGDRNNVVIGSDGAQLCEDPVTHIMTTTACEGGQ